MERGGQVYYYHKDALGSITALTDAQGQVVQTYEYDSFGNITSQTGNNENPFTYTGREYDKETGLYYYRARYYDAKAGRFINEDPIGFKYDELNLYSYAIENPIVFIDFSGFAAYEKKGQIVGNDYFGIFNYKAEAANEIWPTGNLYAGAEGSVMQGNLNGQYKCLFGGVTGYKTHAKAELGMKNWTAAGSLKFALFEGEVSGGFKFSKYYLKGTLGGTLGSLGVEAKLGKKGVKLGLHKIIGASLGLEWGNISELHQENCECK